MTNQAAYSAAFPSGGGAVLKFTSATDFDLYAAPVTADSKPVSSGTMVGTNATAAGVTFAIGGTPGAGDQFSIQSNNHQTQNVLDTLSQMVTALNLPVDGDPVVKQNSRSHGVGVGQHRQRVQPDWRCGDLDRCAGSVAG